MSAANESSTPGPGGNVRWGICALLFAATALNYVDRQIIGILEPTLAHRYHWTPDDYGDIVFWFQVGYAIGYLIFGKLIDRIGAKAGFAVAVGLWTVAHIAHAWVTTLNEFIVARFAVGLGEAGNFPAALKATAEWFPQEERALATGLFNAGSNVGAIVTPLLVPAVTLAFGWRAAFLITGCFTIIWLVVWLVFYRAPERHSRLNAQEFQYITRDSPTSTSPVPWRKLLRVRETWGFAIAKFLTDPIWWMYLFWLPDFLVQRHHLNLASFGIPLVVIYVISDLGSIAGGWMSSRLIKAGVTVNAARKYTMLLCAVLVTPIMAAARVHSLWAAVAIIALATAAHQGFSCNLFTVPSDIVPRRAVGALIGIGGTAGAIGGMLIAKYAGWVLERMGTFTPIFVVAGSVYFLALLIVHLTSPRLEPARLD